ESPAVESVAEKSARLDALVGELLALSRQENADGQAAWAALSATRDRINAEARRRFASAQDAQKTAADPAREWVEAVSQLADPARRDRALQEIATALVWGPADLQLAACWALAKLGEVKFEKQSFRAPLLAVARSSEGQLRVAALYALANTERRPEDLALAL